MEFCKKCGGLLVPQKKGKSVVLVCRKCGAKRTGKVKPKDFKIGVSTKLKKEKVIVVDKKSRFEALPKTTAQCPKCENSEAYWWMEQTRAADEAPTRFYKCTKCSHVWREYE
jgi:DNA-directed RNA polymerase subunit M